MHSRGMHELRLHVLGVPGQELTRENTTCAYTAKAIKFERMMSARGHEVVLHPEPYCDTLRSAEEGDILCISYGHAQKRIAELHPHLTAVEYGVGYGGIFADYCVFESYAWMHTVYGALAVDPHQANGRFYDAVIPNYFDVDEFPAGTGKGEYLLYIGRLVERKGVEIAVKAAERLGMELICAGEGDFRPEPATYIGSVGATARADLMGGATAVLAPTIYTEPFGGVAVEAQLTGTPVITTDWGAFPETVEQGVTGFRCRTLGEFVHAIAMAGTLDRDAIRDRAISKYSLEAVAPMYERYFDQLQTLSGDGWYSDWSGLTSTQLTP